MNIDPGTLDFIKAIYLSSFPEDERRPWNDIVAPAQLSGPRLEQLRSDGGEVAGFITYWEFDKFVYIEHFAIDGKYRGIGLGTNALKKFLSNFTVPVVLEVERPWTSAEAERRVEFYKRLGFEVISTEYIQPPYQPGLNPVPMWLLSTSCEIACEEVVSRLYSEVYNT